MELILDTELKLITKEQSIIPHDAKFIVYPTAALGLVIQVTEFDAEVITKIAPVEMLLIIERKELHFLYAHIGALLGK